MRITRPIFVGIVTALAVVTTPVLAKNSEAQRNEEKPASSCSAYQQAPDGSWTRLPCQEAGAHAQAQTQHRRAVQGSDDEER